MALALAIAVSAVGCKKEPAMPAASGALSFEWSQRSPDGKVEIRQRRQSNGTTSSCLVQAISLPGGNVLWSGSTCIPAPSGLVFFAKGNDKLLVLDLFPSAVVQSPDWSKVSLVQLWNKGAVAHEYRGAEILAADRAADMRRSFSWLRGETYDEVRGSARAVGDGTQVSMDLADGRTITLGFDGAALPTPPSVSPRARAPEVAAAPEPVPAALPPRDEPPPAAPAPAAQADGLFESGLYRWEDDSGALHFGRGAQVPSKYQKRARLVQGQVGIVPMEAPPAPNDPAKPGAANQAGQPTSQATAPSPSGAPPAAPPAAQADAPAPREGNF